MKVKEGGGHICLGKGGGGRGISYPEKKEKIKGEGGGGEICLGKETACTRRILFYLLFS